ncbi:MAG: CFI-box-CTERM domain-containing protein [Lachnospiraceae bacterium]
MKNRTTAAELNCFRNYRDTYLLTTDEGEAIVQEYYDIAPTIVKHINRAENSREIYASIWEEYLSPCLHLIEEDRKEDCQVLYTKWYGTWKRNTFTKIKSCPLSLKGGGQFFCPCLKFSSPEIL